MLALLSTWQARTRIALRIAACSTMCTCVKKAGHCCGDGWHISLHSSLQVCPGHTGASIGAAQGRIALPAIALLYINSAWGQGAQDGH
jgi:hypothetical protein